MMSVGSSSCSSVSSSSSEPSRGIYKGHCFRINHFPEDNDYDHDSSEYLLRNCSLQNQANDSAVTS
ncbi:hypothetical protein IHE44_0006925 [Lamprotornis superbus]|uniref:Uncharacterized protein n=1 Tax=Lamprotornis superbus TaxID=245042 RepID=A0A835NW18_9PASS|nr:hypothetical protein IHE44_0006925 [Lamprotornis superbus]